MKKFLLALIAIFVLAGCGSDPKGVAEDFIRALYEGDSKTLVDVVYIPDKERSREGATEMINGKLMQMAGAGREEASKRGGLKSVSGELQTISEESATVEVSASFKNGTSRTEGVKLVKKKMVSGKSRFSEKVSHLLDICHRRAWRALDAHARAYGKRAATDTG